MRGCRCRYLLLLWMLCPWLPVAAAAGATGVGLAGFGASTAGEPSASAGLLELMERRLQLMPQVAAYKWHNRQPVQDPEREAVVVAEARAQALRQGLVPDTVERLFLAQMAAARSVQSWWMAEWQAGRAAPPPAPDLAGSIRPELSRLGEQIVIAAVGVARFASVASGGVRVGASARQAVIAEPPGSTRIFAMPGLDDAQRGALLAAAAAVEAYPHRLAQILATGRLRIGTTGDYAPFSYRRDGTPDFTGIDVDLGRDLAAALDVEAEFVLTSWSTLLDDLDAGRYDIAMSGVSRTLARQRVGLQSRPYYADGKTPIARCADLNRFANLDGIDRPGVRVVVNPGGTNERFVDERIRRADKVLHPDNRTIFAEILAGRADVMFTDRIEVELQTRRHPELCATMAANLTYQEKTYLVPQDAIWLEFVDTWLALRQAEGKVDEVFAAHGFERTRPR